LIRYPGWLAELGTDNLAIFDRVERVSADSNPGLVGDGRSRDVKANIELIVAWAAIRADNPDLFGPIAYGPPGILAIQQLGADGVVSVKPVKRFQIQASLEHGYELFRYIIGRHQLSLLGLCNVPVMPWFSGNAAELSERRETTSRFLL